MVVSPILYVHPYLGKIPILTNIFQSCWFNHQLEGVFVGWHPFGLVIVTNSVDTKVYSTPSLTGEAIAHWEKGRPADAAAAGIRLLIFFLHMLVLWVWKTSSYHIYIYILVLYDFPRYNFPTSPNFLQPGFNRLYKKDNPKHLFLLSKCGNLKPSRSKTFFGAEFGLED